MISRQQRKKSPDRRVTRELTSNEKTAIEIMFWGPYDPSWRNEEGVIDNCDHTISQRLELPFSSVANYTARISRLHFIKLSKEKNKKQ